MVHWSGCARLVLPDTIFYYVLPLISRPLGCWKYCWSVTAVLLQLPD